jgi:MbtH protein
MSLFDDEESQFFVLVNSEGQHSLWPTAVTVPEGWTVGYGGGDRFSCLEYVRENWIDMRPLSLIKEIGSLALTDVQSCGQRAMR